MKKSYKLSGGFTMIEIMVAIGILGLIASIGLVMDLSFLKSDILQAEQSIIISTLEKARSRSMNNMFGLAHGFCYDNVSKKYIIFRGRITCLPTSATDETIEANVAIAENPGSSFPGSIVFSQLAGTTTSATIVITDGVRKATTTINYEGTISW